MEKRLRKLFDFQKFDGNGDLQQVINSVHSRYGIGNRNNDIRELTLDEMSRLSAAGTPEIMTNQWTTNGEKNGNNLF